MVMETKDDRGAEGAAALTEMMMGFRVTQLLYVATKLGIADLLKDGPRSVGELAQATGAHERSLYRVLRALASVGVFAEDGEGRFGLTPMAEMLQSGVANSQRAKMLYYGDPTQWRTWGELMYSVKTGETGFEHVFGMGKWEYREQHREENDIFNDFMTENTRGQTSAVVAAYDFSGMRTVVDVGGGHGALMAAILEANPSVRGIVCDMAHVVEGAQEVLEAAGVADRCEVAACDFFESVPGGGDAYILKVIIHDWDDKEAATILKTVRRAMSEGGRLLLVENVIPPGNGAHPGKMLDIVMLVELGGRERTGEEYEALLGEAGFRMTRIVPTEGPLSIVEGVAV
jgi:predicted O-methyltransferase YrrM